MSQGFLPDCERTLKQIAKRCSQDVGALQTCAE